MNQLEAYYNKFNEEKRLNSRHGQVEYAVTMHFLKQYLDALEESGMARQEIKILDVGAGTGRYAIPLSEEGYDVTAVEPVHHNLGRIRANGPLVKAYEGRAEKLKRFSEDSYDIVLFFGPM
ncbi:MAG: methyltransferase domain-containing protein, partial [Lachnospiraceae bacterium]|nr:methyltransferase domain-containing protein [Lachnospiraceae bacterium]